MAETFKKQWLHFSKIKLNSEHFLSLSHVASHLTLTKFLPEMWKRAQMESTDPKVTKLLNGGSRIRIKAAWFYTLCPELPPSPSCQILLGCKSYVVMHRVQKYWLIPTAICWMLINTRISGANSHNNPWSASLHFHFIEKETEAQGKWINLSKVTELQ